MTEGASASSCFVDDARFVVHREARRIRLGHHHAERLLPRDDDPLGDAVARESAVLDPAVDRVLAPFEPRFDHHAREPRRRRVLERVDEGTRELVVGVDTRDPPLPPAARWLHDDGVGVVTDEGARGVERRARGERRDLNPPRGVRGAHRVLLLAASNRLGIGVEGEGPACGDVGDRSDRDLAAGARDGADPRSLEQRRDGPRVARRHLLEGVAVRHADGVRVHVDAEHVEGESARGANERELREAAPDDEDARGHDDGGVGAAGVRGFNELRNSSSSAWWASAASSPKFRRSAML